MVRALLALCLAAFFGLLWAPRPAPQPVVPPPVGPSSRPAKDPSIAPVESGTDPDCGGSCSAVADGPSVTGPATIRHWLKELRSQPLSGESQALETLLFHREAARAEKRTPDFAPKG